MTDSHEVMLLSITLLIFFFKKMLLTKFAAYIQIHAKLFITEANTVNPDQTALYYKWPTLTVIKAPQALRNTPPLLGAPKVML